MNFVSKTALKVRLILLLQVKLLHTPVTSSRIRSFQAARGIVSIDKSLEITIWMQVNTGPLGDTDVL